MMFVGMCNMLQLLQLSVASHGFVYFLLSFIMCLTFELIVSPDS